MWEGPPHAVGESGRGGGAPGRPRRAPACVVRDVRGQFIVRSPLLKRLRSVRTRRSSLAVLGSDGFWCCDSWSLVFLES